MHYLCIKICVQGHLRFTNFINFHFKMSDLYFLWKWSQKIAPVLKLKNRELEFGNFWIKTFFANFGHWRQNLPLRRTSTKTKASNFFLMKSSHIFGIKHVMRTNRGKVMDEKRKKWECRNVTSFCFFLS